MLLESTVERVNGKRTRIIADTLLPKCTCHSKLNKYQSNAPGEKKLRQLDHSSSFKICQN